MLDSPPIRKLLLVALLPALAALGLAGPSAAQAAKPRIHLIHGIPGVAVDVEIAGEIAIEDFEVSETEDLSALAGQTLADVKVKAAGTDDVAIDVGDLALPSTGSVTAIAHLDAAGKPVLTVFTNDTSTIAAGEGRLVVRHTAAAPAVDVLAGDTVAFANVANGKEGKADLPAGTIKASVVPTGAKEPVVIGPADLPVAEGSALIVYAIGSLEAGNLTVLTETLTGLDGSPTAVHTGNSPVPGDGVPADGVPADGRLGLPGAVALAGAASVALGTAWYGRGLVARIWAR